MTKWSDLEGLSKLPEAERKRIFVSGHTDRVDRDFYGEEGIAHNLERICKDQYVLLPNLEKNKHGVFGNESGRTLYMKAEDWFVGGIVGGGKPTDEDAIRGKNTQNYASRAVACLRTSDQRGQDQSIWFGDRLGHPNCVSWLKLSEPTATSITQALISGEGRRVFTTAPSQPGDRIENLVIEGAEIFAESRLEIAFSPNLNTFIGGRGTGKSLVISALVRLFGADAEWSSKSPDQLSPWEARHLALFGNNGPFVSPEVSFAVEYTKDSGVRYRLTIECPGEPLLTSSKLEMWTGQQWTLVGQNEAIARSMDFRPLFFLQGQMSAMTGSGSDQKDLVRLIEGPIRESRRALRAQLQTLSETVQIGFQLKRTARQLHERSAQLTAQVTQKAGERSAFLEAAKKGLTESQQAIFADAEVLRKGKTAAQSLEDRVSDATKAVDDAAKDLEAALQAQREGIKNLQASRVATFTKDGYLDGLLNVATEAVKGLRKIKSDLDNGMQEAKRHKTQVLERLNELISKAVEVSQQERARREALKKAEALEQEIAELNKEKTAAEQDLLKISRGQKIEAGEAALEQFKELVKSYSKQLIERATQISRSPDSRLIVKVIPGGIYPPILDKLQEICGGCGIREKTWRLLEEKLAASPSPASIITELISSTIAALSNPESQTIPKIWEEAGFSDVIYKNILAKTDPEDWVELSVELADDKVDVLYKKGEGKTPIPILNASPGERAVELLRLALFSTSGPIVIDQPEDDLDNHFLADKLVELVQQSKHKNQLIFASHNANLVVHGDAEAIDVMEAKDLPENKVGCALALVGTIDQEDVCLEVERVMEGGRPAFEHRRRKYQETVGPDRPS